jgi:hypothetical protein
MGAPQLFRAALVALKAVLVAKAPRRDLLDLTREASEVLVRAEAGHFR